MSEKNKLNQEQLQAVSGGKEIKRASEKTEEEYRKEELERRIAQLKEARKNAKNAQEALKLMEKIIELLRELQGYENNIITRND